VSAGSFLVANGLSFPVMVVVARALGWGLPSAAAWGLSGILAGALYGAMSGAMLVRLLRQPPLPPRKKRHEHWCSLLLP